MRLRAEGGRGPTVRILLFLNSTLLTLILGFVGVIWFISWADKGSHSPFAGMVGFGSCDAPSTIREGMKGLVGCPYLVVDTYTPEHARVMIFREHVRPAAWNSRPRYAVAEGTDEKVCVTRIGLDQLPVVESNGIDNRPPATLAKTEELDGVLMYYFDDGSMSANVPGVHKTPGIPDREPSPDQRERIEKQYRDWKRGVGNNPNVTYR